VPDGGYVSACANSYTYNVTISTTTSGAQIRWTIDGSIPSPTHGTLINGSSGIASFIVGNFQTKTLRAIAFKTGMTNSNIKSADYSFERDCGQGPSEPTKEETTVDDLLSLPEGMDPESLQTADRRVYYYADGAGNRTTVTDDVNGNTSYTPNDFNQYTALTGTTITNGPEHEIASYGNSNYTYLNDEHLIEVTNTTDSTGTNDYQFAYDALGRCVKRIVNGVTKYYIYDGEKAILEYKLGGGLLGRNVYGKGIDEILMRTDYTFSPPLTLYYQQDHEGSVTYLTSTSGNVLERYRYDAYGAPTIYPPSPGATPIPVSLYSNRFMFTGREYSNMFGFYEYRARAYNPTLGRFMSEDPKLFDAGDYNLFRYCHNDPIDFTDPMGLESPAWAQAIIPGQIEWDNAVANFQAGNYGSAAGWAATMVAQQFLAVGTLGTSTRVQQSLQAARLAMAEGQAGNKVAAVIGKYPNYLKVADQIGAKRFNIPTNVWNKMTEAERWIANQKFLDRAISRGGDVMLDRPIKEISSVSGALRKELNYLSQRGYELSRDGSRMIRSPQFEAQIEKGAEEAAEKVSNAEHGLNPKPQ
jgi:RHS repeat-associated protein